MLYRFRGISHFRGGRLKTAESESSLQKWTFWAPMFFGVGPIFMGVPPLTNNTAITSGGKDLVKIRPAVAEQSRKKIKKKRRQNASYNTRRRKRRLIILEITRHVSSITTDWTNLKSRSELLIFFDIVILWYVVCAIVNALALHPNVPSTSTPHNGHTLTDVAHNWWNGHSTYM